MGVKRLTAAVAVMAMVLVTAGCFFSDAVLVTDEQVAGWKELATQTIPAAQEVMIEADEESTMGGSLTYIRIEIVFADFADLKASEQAIFNLQDVVQEEAPGALVDFWVVNAGGDAHAAEISARLVRDVPGVASAEVIEGFYSFDHPPDSFMWGNLVVYMDDESVLSPNWLDQVSDITQTGLDEVDARIGNIYILPASAVDLEFADPLFRDTAIRVADLDSFKDFGVDHECVRTERWAYDVGASSVSVYPKDEPEGACS